MEPRFDCFIRSKLSLLEVFLRFFHLFQLGAALLGQFGLSAFLCPADLAVQAFCPIAQFCFYILVKIFRDFNGGIRVSVFVKLFLQEPVAAFARVFSDIFQLPCAAFNIGPVFTHGNEVVERMIYSAH